MQEHIGKADIETLIPDQLKGLFCEPPLLEGEDPKLYWGLLAALVAEHKPLAKAKLMMRWLVPDQTDEKRVLAAIEMVQARLVQMRVAAIRNTMLAKLDPSVDLAELRRLAALDRYEARALTRRRRASRTLQG
jgi:hypothetical protein